MNLSDKIKAIRKAKGITPTVMAKHLDIEPTNYPRIENRGNKLTYDYIEKIAQALELTVVELLTWGDKQLQLADPKKVTKINQDLDRSNELIKYQKEKISYLKSTICDVIVNNAYTDFQEEKGFNESIEDDESKEQYFVRDEKEWQNFLGLYIIQNGWVFSLVDKGVVNEEDIISVDPDTLSIPPVREDVRRKRLTRQNAYKRSEGEAF